MVTRREAISVCSMLSNELRVAILQKIDSEGQQTTEEMKRFLGDKHSDAMIANSIRTLKTANILELIRDGRTPVYRLNRDNPMTGLAMEILEAIEPEAARKSHTKNKKSDGVVVTI